MSKQRTSLPRKGGAEPRRSMGTGWPLYLGLAALVLVAAGALMMIRRPDTAPAPGQAAGARLAVDQEKIDFGDVSVNKMVQASFILSNTGTEPLQILSQPKVRVVEGC